jgi:hypothetical protein
VPTSPKSSRIVPGILLIVFGATCNAIGVGLTVAPKEGRDASAGIFWMAFSIIAMVGPGILLVILGRKQARRTAQLEKIVALATASQRLPIDVLASDLGVKPKEARDLLLAAIGERRVIGRLDLEQGMFISGSTHGGVQQIAMLCKNCGARPNVIVSAASASLCPYCGFRLA